LAVRHEEKYIISYKQYAVLKQRAMQLLTPDAHGASGSYVINSLYFDDRKDTALLEKLDGLPEHSKFRIRAYDYDPGFIRLERKDKRGILTEKFSSPVSEAQYPLLAAGEPEPGEPDTPYFSLAAQMRKTGLYPTVVVRYERDAFFFRGSDLRLTFDKNLEAIGPDPAALFDADIHGAAALSRAEVIMEIKYGTHVPTLIRKLTNVDCKQLSVSKYALCRASIAMGRRL